MTSSASINALPNELLLAIFETIFTLSDSSSAYETLLTTAQVCRRWGSASAKVLLSNVEITKRADALRLIHLLETTTSEFSVETLTVGIGGSQEPDLLDDQLFLQLLSLTPRLRKLTILHQNSLPCLPTILPPLPYLTDVTIAPAGGAPAAMAETTLIQQLPSSVRFLTLPATERTRFVEPAKYLCPPTFGLYGIEVQDFPSPSTNWALTGSKDSLQAISAVYVSNRFDEVVQRHPNIRSIRILGRTGVGSARDGFSKFTKLERLELRDLSVPAEAMETLPQSLEYLRVWATPLAVKVGEMIEAGRYPNLKTLVWDHYTPLAKGAAGERAKAAAERMRMNLKAICERNGVSLKMGERVDGGLRSGLGKDHAYESQFHSSCFRFTNESTPFSSSLTSLTKLPTRILRHMHTSQIQLANHFRCISPFMDNVPGKWPGIWDDVFEGHGEWLERTFPRLSEGKNQKRAGDEPSKLALVTAVLRGNATVYNGIM